MSPTVLTMFASLLDAKMLNKKCLIRGGIKIENQENLGHCPNGGGGTQKCPNFNFGILKTEGGSLFFKNVQIENSPQTPSKIKRINLLFLVFSHAIMPVFMST